jgi:hypothetical protein
VIRFAAGAGQRTPGQSVKGAFSQQTVMAMVFKVAIAAEQSIRRVRDSIGSPR